jgi:hypothetical protein
MIIAAAAVSSVADKDEMRSAAQPGARIISAAKVNAKDASPTSITIDETRLKFSEKSILRINPLRQSLALFPCLLFLQLIDGKEIVNEKAALGRIAA